MRRRQDLETGYTPAAPHWAADADVATLESIDVSGTPRPSWAEREPWTTLPDREWPGKLGRNFRRQLGLETPTPQQLAGEAALEADQARQLNWDLKGLGNVTPAWNTLRAVPRPDVAAMSTPFVDTEHMPAAGTPERAQYESVMAPRRADVLARPRIAADPVFRRKLEQEGRMSEQDARRQQLKQDAIDIRTAAPAVTAAAAADRLATRGTQRETEIGLQATKAEVLQQQRLEAKKTEDAFIQKHLNERQSAKLKARREELESQGVFVGSDLYVQKMKDDADAAMDKLTATSSEQEKRDVRTAMFGAVNSVMTSAAVKAEDKTAAILDLWKKYDLALGRTSQLTKPSPGGVSPERQKLRFDYPDMTPEDLDVYEAIMAHPEHPGAPQAFAKLQRLYKNKLKSPANAK